MSSRSKKSQGIDARKLEEYDKAVLEKYLFSPARAASFSSSRNETALVVESFERLVEYYVIRQQWSSLLNLFEKVDQGAQSGRQPAMFAQVLKRTGDAFFKMKSKLNALEFYRKSVSLSGGSDLFALESYENLLNELIDRWHFPMMNDRVRNEAYSKAFHNYAKKYLESAEVSGLRVLDIGCGTGLLSALFADNFYQLAKHDDKSAKLDLFACEQNEVFVHLAKEFLQTVQSDYRQLHNRDLLLKVIEKHSDDLDVSADFDKPQKLNLIITEIFDDGLLGEHCLDTFYSAIVANQIASPLPGLPITIPKFAKLFVAAVECEYLRKSSRFAKTYQNSSTSYNVTVRSVDDATLFDKSDEDPLAECYEPYTTENLNKHDFRLLTDKLELDEFEVKFSDPDFLKKYCERNETACLTKKLKCQSNGRLDAYVLWFKLFLDDEVSITNAPASFKDDDLSSQSSCWHQAVYTVKSDVHVRKEQDLEIELKLRKDCVLIESKHRVDQQDQAVEIEFKASSDSLLMLNDSKYQEFYSNWTRKSLQSSQKSPIRILYFAETFNLALFDILFEQSDRDVYVDLVINDENQVYLKACLESNDDLNKKMKRSRLLKTQDLVNSSESIKYDYFITSPVDPNLGILRMNFFVDLILLSKSCSENVRLFPMKVSLRGMFVECLELMNECQITSSSNFALRSGNYMNHGQILADILKKFQVRHQLKVNMPMFEKSLKRLTDVQTIFTFDLAELCNGGEMDMNRLKETILELRKRVEFPFINAGDVNSFLYWYVLEGENNEVYDFSQHVAASINFYGQSGLVVKSKEKKLSADFLFDSYLFNVTNLELK